MYVELKMKQFLQKPSSKSISSSISGKDIVDLKNFITTASAR